MAAAAVSPSPVAAARHVCQEARVVLTSLRSGPPHVARGDLSSDLMDVRERLARWVEQQVSDEDNDSFSMPIDVARPFLAVVTDPRAAGPHTLVALRGIFRMLEFGSLQAFGVALEQLLQGVLACKFEQTDAGADEAVEMAIADVLSLIVLQDCAAIPETILVDAFNTVFVTRNTFVHSPALCYHFEDVLTTMVDAVFKQKTRDEPARRVFEFITGQLLHTPLVGGDGLDEATREAQMAHDATRILCLRLTRRAVQTRWSEEETDAAEDPLLTTIQDDLCLALLMTGQAIWAYHDTHTNISPGFVSLEVLSEITATISSLWTNLCLRKHLIAQFETILTGFYTRALVLLRKRKQPTNSLSFNANYVFDAEVEIILESLVDILCLHDHRRSIADGDGGALETIFVYYDCHMRRSDVASGLMVELCRCCGGAVNEDGDIVFSPSTSMDMIKDHSDSGKSEEGGGEATGSETSFMVQVEHPWRQVPAHLKELCAQALMGGMKCLFRDDNASADTMQRRYLRKRSIMLRQVDSLDDDQAESTHYLRDVKSKKRLMRKAARVFNKKASRGIEFLLDSGLVPDPVTPESVARFLRNGIVVGLDKKAVGAYLGEAGKAPMAGKSPPSWERDWFHKDVLKIFCSLFRFENQSLLDGLRMFLAAFRLPGEAQQIDRILQAFADSCSQVCEESANGRLKILSDDPKRASDAAYLLSFSIIMLNTDRHNPNIREDRKMSVDDFVKNNSDYGRDITEKGKEFPREFLKSIYDSINEEEIRTEGEGADGAMTVERWKDVLRGSTDDSDSELHPSVHDAEDLTELVLEHVWKPIMSAIGALWGVRVDDDDLPSPNNTEGGHSGMLGVQGARLGMDMSIEMLKGVRKLGRIDIFRKIFTWVCGYTGLLGEYSSDAVGRTWALTSSVESQSAVIVALTTAVEAGEDLDEDGWKRVWSILFELRDLKLIPHRSAKSRSIMHESDPDLLTDNARREWMICLMKGDMNFDATTIPKSQQGKGTSLFGAFGRALFGGEATTAPSHPYSEGTARLSRSAHGKEDLVIWDECAPSDDEGASSDEMDGASPERAAGFTSPGAKFEGHIIRESVSMSQQMDMPVTGLERVEETRRFHDSPRARVRERIRASTALRGLVSDTRFMDDSGIQRVLKGLVDLIASANRPALHGPPLVARREMDRSGSESSSSSSSYIAAQVHVPISPASEAFAEVLLCEIALKNKDRLKLLWTSILQDHYMGRLSSLLVGRSDGASSGDDSSKIPVDPGLEKRVTGLIRISLCAVQREEIATDVLSTWKYLLPAKEDLLGKSSLRALDRHFGEGLWRLSSEIDYLRTLGVEAWEGILAILNWCASRGGYLKPVPYNEIEGRPAFTDDDPALQAYRSLHLLLSTDELLKTVPLSVIDSLRMLVVAGEKRHYSQLSIATLDLLPPFLEKRKAALEDKESATDVSWALCWRTVVEGIAEAVERSSDTVSSLFGAS